jgi:hypothetical protein
MHVTYSVIWLVIDTIFQKDLYFGSKHLALSEHQAGRVTYREGHC